MHGVSGSTTYIVKMYLLHKVYSDGSSTHEAFTQALWEEAMHLPSLKKFWGHADGDCVDPQHELLAKRRQLGAELTPEQHAMADAIDPGWIGDRGAPAEAAPPVPPQVEELQQSVEFPPPQCPNILLERQLLSEMSGLCLDDVRATVLPEIESKLDELPPAADKRGQFLLF